MALFARNFATGEAMNDRFFSLAVFMHIGLPLFALAATWAHFLRLAHVRVWPPVAVGVPATGAPALRASVPRERVRVVFCGSDRSLVDRAIGEIAEVGKEKP